MSPLKLHSLLTGVLIALIVAVCNSAVAQDGLRLWKPYTPESFGGGRHSNDGVYASLSGIYWSFSAPKGGYIGATTTRGGEESRYAYSVEALRVQETNTLKVNMIDATTTLGTRFEVGNRRGHHGWLASGYNLPTQSHRLSSQGISTVAIRDEGNFSFDTYRFPTTTTTVGEDGETTTSTSAGGLAIGNTIFLWDRAHNTLYDPRGGSIYGLFHPDQVKDGTVPVHIGGVGFLWGVFPYEFTSGAAEGEDGEDSTFVLGYALLAPLPVKFNNVDVNVRSRHSSAELMYTYRPHPFTWGTMELLAGARYFDFEDSFGFDGRNTDLVGTGDTDTGDTADGGTGSLFDRIHLSALSEMVIDARAENRIFGPQFGIKTSRQNARWSFNAEGRFTAGLNLQALKTQGHISSAWTAYRQGSGNAAVVTYSDVPIYTPVGLMEGATGFNHKQNKTYFSPILELRLSADWQWTESVSFFGAFDAMYADNIARGVRVTDYVVRNDRIFGIRGNDRNTNVIVYGVETGIKVRR